MNKKEFTKYMEEQTQGMTEKQKIALLRRMQGNWVPTLIRNSQKELGLYVEPKNEHKYVKCRKCGRYFLKNDIKSKFEEETTKECTYTARGQGDDDMIGDVTYNVEYKTCPWCHRRQVISKTHVRTENETKS